MRILFLVLTMLLTAPMSAQRATVNRQRHFPKTIPAGNYSGITWMGGDRYAVVDGMLHEFAYPVGDGGKLGGIILGVKKREGNGGHGSFLFRNKMHKDGLPDYGIQNVLHLPKTFRPPYTRYKPQMHLSNN